MSSNTHIKYSGAKGILALAFLLFLVGCHDTHDSNNDVLPLDKHAHLFEVDRPISKKYSREIKFHGIVQGFQSIPVSFLEDGRLESLAVVEGEVVQAGQVIASLHSPSFAENLSQAEAELERVSVTVKANIEKLARNVRLFRKGIISQQALDLVKEAFDISVQEQKEAAAQVEARQKDLAGLTLTSKEEGIVSVVHKRQGDFLAAGEPVLYFNSTSRQKISFNVPENVAIKLALGETNNVYLPALGDVVSAKLIEKSHPTDSGQFFHKLTYEMISNEFNIIGLRASLVLNTEHALAYSIDYRSVRYDKDGQAYAVKNDGEMSKIPLDVIDLTGQEAIVMASFDENDALILGSDVSLPINYATF